MAAVRAGHAAPVAGGDPMRFVSLVRGGRTWGEVGARASVWSEVGATLLNFAQLCTTLLNFANYAQPIRSSRLLVYWGCNRHCPTLKRRSPWAELVLWPYV